jgi:hypothetical protein
MMCLWRFQNIEIGQNKVLVLRFRFTTLILLPIDWRTDGCELWTTQSASLSKIYNDIKKYYFVDNDKNAKY